MTDCGPCSMCTKPSDGWGCAECFTPLCVDCQDEILAECDCCREGYCKPCSLAAGAPNQPKELENGHLECFMPTCSHCKKKPPAAVDMV